MVVVVVVLMCTGSRSLTSECVGCHEELQAAMTINLSIKSMRQKARSHWGNVLHQLGEIMWMWHGCLAWLNECLDCWISNKSWKRAEDQTEKADFGEICEEVHQQQMMWNGKRIKIKLPLKYSRSWSHNFRAWQHVDFFGVAGHELAKAQLWNNLLFSTHAWFISL
jgi:hypothetical protein